MKTLAVAIGFVILVTGATVGPAAAGEVLKPTVFEPNPFAHQMSGHKIGHAQDGEGIVG